MNWLYYLAEANLYLCVFYVAYCIFLVRETHYQLNRAYLLLSCVAAFVLPVLQISALRPAIEPTIADTHVAAPTEPTFYYYLWIAYVVGAVVVVLFLALKLYSVIKLTRTDVVTYGKYKMVYLKDTDVAFSFFNYLFIGTRAECANTIITHELVHIRQRHSADIMFLELLKAICWFNPCIYLLQNSLKTVHEYIADEQTAATEADALTYSSFLVNNAYGAGGSSITHSFFNYNLLKKRIVMLNQQRSGKLTRLKYLVALPAFAGMLCASTLGFSKNYGWIDLSPAQNNANSKAAITPNNGIRTANADTAGKQKSPAPKRKYDVVKFPPKVDANKLPPPPPPEPPKAKTDIVKFPPKVSNKKLPHTPPNPNMDQVKFPPPTVKDKKLPPPPPEPPKPKKTDMVKFPPKVVVGKNGELIRIPPPPEPPKPKKTDMVKFPPKVNAKKLPQPPPPEPPKPKN